MKTGSDVDRVMQVVFSKEGNIGSVKSYMKSSGVTSSAFEHSVPEEALSASDNQAFGISAVKALKMANQQSIPIYSINQSNINSVMPGLQVDSDVVTAITNAVNAGKEVVVSKTNITTNDWTGCGYIVLDPITGAGAYMISGSSNGAIIVALFTIVIMLALIALLAQGGVIFIFGAAIICGGTVIEAILASIILLSTKLFFLFYLSNQKFYDWVQSQKKNITDFSTQAVGQILEVHPLSLITELLAILVD